MSKVLVGATAGLLATIPMTAVIMGGRRAGLLAVPPPEQITDATLEAAVDKPAPRGPLRTATWVSAHLAYGAACGALFAALRSRLPGMSPSAGLLFGGAVWGISYGPLMPALDLYPSVSEDRSTRTAVMIAAHAVFGTATAALYDGLTHQRA
jgi:hypothetical protein